jgi:MFS family permease
MSRPRTFPIVLAGFTAFLDLYATQPLLPLLMRVFNATHVAVSLTVTASTVASRWSARGRPAADWSAGSVIVGSSLALPGDGAGSDLEQLAATDLLAVHAGLFPRRSPSRLHYPRRVAAVPRGRATSAYVSGRS